RFSRDWSSDVCSSDLDLLLRFAPKGFTGEISHSIVFILSFIIISQVLSLPSSIYNTFVLEEKFGFNKQTPKLFVVDMIKTNLLRSEERRVGKESRSTA